MILRERDTQEGLLVAVCDPEVLGETFEDGDVSLTATEEFYGGEQVDEQEVVESLSRATVANIVGTDAVSLAIESGFVDEANVLDIDSTRHAQFLRM
jgi:hypothetical protein